MKLLEQMTINCKGKLIDLSVPKVMGILNVTPDSFFDGGKYSERDAIVARAEEILGEGADFIDIGGYSSRPGASDVPESEEMSRVVDAVRTVVDAFPDAIISVDTFRSSVAKATVDAGAAIINDISAGSLDPQMMPTVAELRVPYIMMHMRGTPSTMTQFTEYDHVVTDMMKYFSGKILEARSYGISDLILDPGFGFSKTLEQNYEVMNHLDIFRQCGLPILVGVSRKSMLTKLLNVNPESALNGTTALHMASLMKGASILRVHDVKEAVECIRIWKALERNH